MDICKMGDGESRVLAIRLADIWFCLNLMAFPVSQKVDTVNTELKQGFVKSREVET
ncbi:hypothetical protein MJD09_14900 [bacterium]|nr:hypothetical protein [bacterium]